VRVQWLKGAHLNSTTAAAPSVSATVLHSNSLVEAASPPTPRQTLAAPLQAGAEIHTIT